MPASCVLYVPEVQGSLPQGGHYCTYTARGVPYVPCGAPQVHALRLPGQFTARGGTEGLSDEATHDLAASMAGLNASDADLRGPTGAAWANDQRKSKGGRCAEEE